MNTPAPDKITKAERTEITSLIRKRERVMKAAAAERAGELMADFETQLSAIYHYDEQDVWREANAIAEEAVKTSNAAIAARCEELGIPSEFAPRLEFGWYGRGSNAIASRRAELRKMAQAQIAMAERSAKTRIEKLSLDAQTELVTAGLISDAAKLFLEQMPTVETLMPRLDAVETRKLLK